MAGPRAWAMGMVPIVVYVGDYRAVDGVMLPHRVRQVIAGMQEMLFLTESVEHNVEIPRERFQLPADIQALIEKEKSEKRTESPTG